MVAEAVRRLDISPSLVRVTDYELVRGFTQVANPSYRLRVLAQVTSLCTGYHPSHRLLARPGVHTGYVRGP